MGNCYARQTRNRDFDKDNYVDKSIRVQRKIGANFSISKSKKKIGVDTDLEGTLTTTREEKYVNKIPRVLDVVKSLDVATQT